MSRRVGFGVAVLTARPDVLLRAEVPGVDIEVGSGMRVTPILFDVTLHLTPDGTLDLYVGAGLGYVMFGDLSFQPPGEDAMEFDVDNDPVWSVVVGADVGLGDGPWSLSASLRHVDAQLAVKDRMTREGLDLDFDSLVATAGVAFRF